MQMPIKEPGYKYNFVLEPYPMHDFKYISSVAIATLLSAPAPPLLFLICFAPTLL